MLGVRVMRTNIYIYIYGDRDSISVNWLRYGLNDQNNGHSRKGIFLLAQGIHIGHGQCTMGNISCRALWKSLVTSMY